jgi:nitrogen regulatory protein PII
MSSEFNEMMAKWVDVDNEIKTLNERAYLLKEKRKSITEELNEYVEDKHVDKKSIDINLNDSQIKFVTTKVTQTLTFKYLEKCLKEIITDDDQVQQIIEYIKQNRTVEEVSEIKRIYKNN